MGKHTETTSSVSTVAKKERKIKKNKYETLSKAKIQDMCRHLIQQSAQLQKTTTITKGSNLISFNTVSSLIDLDQLSCPICLELLILPTLTDCGHMYCLHCA